MPLGKMVVSGSMVVGMLTLASDCCEVECRDGLAKT